MCSPYTRRSPEMGQPAGTGMIMSRARVAAYTLITEGGSSGLRPRGIPGGSAQGGDHARRRYSG
jgi:hypothetical protein